MADESTGTHGYYEWQVNTLMLAYDVVDPLPRADLKGQHERQHAVEREVREIALRVIPPDAQADEARELSPQVVMNMTRATLKRAAEVVGFL